MSRLSTVLACLLLVAGCGDGDPDGGPADAGSDGDATNLPPEIVTTAPRSIELYATLEYDIECTDPEGEEVEIEVTAEDTCRGVLADEAPGRATYELRIDGTDACTLSVSCSDGESEDVQESEIAVEPAADLQDLEFGPLEPWSEPLGDYLEVVAVHPQRETIMKGVHELAVFDSRLYLGFGDATVNMGREFAIDLRYWELPDPAGIQIGFATDEEQVDRYRVYDDLLIVPGVDATEDGLLGNVYTYRPGEDWYKSRTLELAWHVHDAILRDDVIYACGSGGSIEDYESSTVNGLLFASEDGGETFEHVVVYPQPDPPGDNRFTNLLAVGEELYVMGYFTAGSTTYAQAFRLVGDELESWTGLRDFFVTASHSLSPDRGLLVGVNISSPLTWGIRLVTTERVVWPDTLYGDTAIDVQPLGDGRAVILGAVDDEYPSPEGSVEIVAMVIDEDASEQGLLLSQVLESRPLSIAFWRRDIYVGMPDGSVWRAPGL